jgi:hypothetical protein
MITSENSRVPFWKSRDGRKDLTLRPFQLQHPHKAALPDAEFIGDMRKASSVLVRLQPRRRAETATRRDPAGRPRATGKQADALARATDSASAEHDGGTTVAAYRRREKRIVAGAKTPAPEKAVGTVKPKMVRRAPIPPTANTFIRPPTRDQLMGGGRPVSTLTMPMRELHARWRHARTDAGQHNFPILADWHE